MTVKGERVDDEAHVGHPSSRRHVREIGDPPRVRSIGPKAAVHEVWCMHAVGVLAGGEHLSPLATDPALTEALRSHEPVRTCRTPDRRMATIAMSSRSLLFAMSSPSIRCSIESRSSSIVWPLAD
jgi:hypothetical protein